MQLIDDVCKKLSFYSYTDFWPREAVLVIRRYWKKWETEGNYTYTQAQNQFLKVLTLRPSNAQKE